MTGTATRQQRWHAHEMSPDTFKPLLVSSSCARRILGIGHSKFWAMVKAGKIEMTDVGSGRRMVLYASLERLAEPAQQVAA